MERAEGKRLIHAPDTPKATTDVLWSLAVDLTESRICDIRYAAAAGTRSLMIVLPLRLFVSHGLLYLLVHDPRRDQVRTLALHRITSLRVTDTHALAPKGVDAERFVGSLFGVFGTDGPVTTYRLRFGAKATSASASGTRRRRYERARTAGGLAVHESGERGGHRVGSVVEGARGGTLAKATAARNLVDAARASPTSGGAGNGREEVR